MYVTYGGAIEIEYAYIFEADGLGHVVGGVFDILVPSF
jgi:hypothetical protein